MMCCRQSKEIELSEARRRLSLIQQDLNTVDELDGVHHGKFLIFRSVLPFTRPS